MNRRLIELIRQFFFLKIGTKTGWGKNEIEKAFNEAVAEATITLLDENHA